VLWRGRWERELVEARLKLQLPRVSWILDANFKFLTNANFGPIAGWHPEGLGGDGKGNIRLVWRTPANQLNAWVLNANLQAIGSSPVYGPYFGWSFQ
jgi:hypothetical protein